MTPARFESAAAQVIATVGGFHEAVPCHPDLGPIFARHGNDWPTQEARIIRFLRHAVLFDRGYDANAMAVHMALEDLHAPMFSAWLDLFDETLAQVLPADLASALAHCIGRSMRMALPTGTGLARPD